MAKMLAAHSVSSLRILRWSRSRGDREEVQLGAVWWLHVHARGERRHVCCGQAALSCARTHIKAYGFRCNCPECDEHCGWFEWGKREYQCAEVEIPANAGQYLQPHLVLCFIHAHSLSFAFFLFNFVSRRRTWSWWQMIGEDVLLGKEEVKNS